MTGPATFTIIALLVNSPPRATERHFKPEDDHRPTEYVAFATTHPQATSQTTPTREDQQQPENAPSGVATALTLIFTGLLAVVGVFQIILMFRQTEQMQRASTEAESQTTAMRRQDIKMAESIKQMERAVDATRATLDHMQERERRELRPHLGVRRAKLKGDPAEGEWPTEIQVRFRNAGQSPARNVAVYLRCVIAPYPDPGKFGEFRPDDIPRARASAMPNGQFEVIKKIPPPDDDGWESVRAGKASVWLYGKFTYTDAFEGVHTTHVRMYWDRKRPLMYFANDGNDAD